MTPFVSSLALLAFVAPFVAAAPSSLGSSPAVNTFGSGNITFDAYVEHTMHRPRPIYAVTLRPAVFADYQEATAVSDKYPDFVLAIAYGKWALIRNGTVYGFATDEYSATITQTFRAGRSLSEAAGQGRIPEFAKRDHPYSWGDWPRKHARCVLGPCDMREDCAMFNCRECVKLNDWAIGECFGEI